MQGTGFGRRLQFVVIGLLAGLCFWQLSDSSWLWDDSSPLLAVSVMALSFFGGLLAMLGTVGLRKSLTAAVAIALPAAVLVMMKMYDYDGAGQMLSSGHILVAIMAIVMLPVPFAIAIMTEGRRGWCDYSRLFTESWNIVVRYATAWLFVAIFWAVLWLLWSLLDLVGITFVGEFLTEAPVVWLISGAVMGLGLAVVTELADTISADLLLRLLRLLVPLVLLVELVFVAVLPASGLSHLFGVFSPTGILLATAIASILLVTISVDANDESAAHARFVTLSARGLAILLPVLAVLAMWSLWLRVSDWGWTPERISAAAMIVLISGYAVSYAIAAFSGHWRLMIRKTNIAMALVVIVVGAFWMTPFFSPEAIAVRSQMARFDNGKTLPHELPFEKFAHVWGVAGKQAWIDLRSRAAIPGQEDLAAALAEFDGVTPPRTGRDVDDRARELANVIKVLPDGASVPQTLFQRIAVVADDTWIESCRGQTVAGNGACLLIIDDFSTLQPGRDAILVRDAIYDHLLGYHEIGGDWVSARPIFLGAGTPLTGADLIDALVQGGGRTFPADIRALSLGGQQLFIAP